MEVICKNCQHVFHGKYCNNCGQTVETHKINAHFLMHDIQHGLFHFDSGVLYSFKQLFTRPGNTIREFIEGKRVKHFKPVSLVVLLATLYGLLYHYFHIDLIIASSTGAAVDYSEINEWVITHFSWITIATIPVFTLGTYICFRNQGYNFMEYFILNTFKASQKLFAHLITFPLIYYFNGTSYIQKIIMILYTVDLILVFWTNIQFFNKMSKAKAFFLSLLSHILFLLFFILILFSVFKIKGLI